MTFSFKWLAGGIVAVVTGVAMYGYVAVAIRPSGPFTPIASVDYFLDQQGATREIAFEPVFLRNHEVAVISSKPFPVAKQFGWELHVEVFRFGIKIDDRNLIEQQRSVVGPSFESSNDVSLGWISVLDCIPGQARMRITVTVPERGGTEYREALKVVVRPSPIL